MEAECFQADFLAERSVSLSEPSCGMDAGAAIPESSRISTESKARRRNLQRWSGL